MQNKWNRRDAKRIRIPKLGIEGTSDLARNQMELEQIKRLRLTGASESTLITD
jgi:hypothetical protein